MHRLLFISAAVLLAVVAALLASLAMLAVPYSVFMIVWFHVPATEVLSATGPVAALLLLVAAALAMASHATYRRKDTEA